MYGTTLMSLIAVVCGSLCHATSERASAACGGTRGLALQDGRELFHERVVALLEPADLVGEAVVRDHRRDRGETGRSRWRSSASAMPGATWRSVACCTLPGRWKALHDAPTGAEEADVGTGWKPTVASVDRLCSGDRPRAGSGARASRAAPPRDRGRRRRQALLPQARTRGSRLEDRLDGRASSACAPR